jgi:hypothetical protein
MVTRRPQTALGFGFDLQAGFAIFSMASLSAEELDPDAPEDDPRRVVLASDGVREVGYRARPVAEGIGDPDHARRADGERHDIVAQVKRRRIDSGQGEPASGCSLVDLDLSRLGAASYGRQPSSG